MAKNLVEEQFCSFRLRFIEKILRSLIFNDPPLIHENYAVRHVTSKVSESYDVVLGAGFYFLCIALTLSFARTSFGKEEKDG